MPEDSQTFLITTMCIAYNNTSSVVNCCFDKVSYISYITIYIKRKINLKYCENTTWLMTRSPIKPLV